MVVKILQVSSRCEDVLGVKLESKKISGQMSVKIL